MFLFHFHLKEFEDGEENHVWENRYSLRNYFLQKCNIFIIYLVIWLENFNTPFIMDHHFR